MTNAKSATELDFNKLLGFKRAALLARTHNGLTAQSAELRRALGAVGNKVGEVPKNEG